MRARLPILLVASLCFTAGSAWAQPSMVTPSQYHPEPSAPAATSAPSPSPSPSKFSVGLHFVGGDLDNPENEFDVADLAGYGVYARYRLSKRLEVEVAFDKLQAEMSNERVRDIRPMTASALLHLIARGNTTFYLRAGLGKAKELYTGADGNSAEFQDKTGHMGLGATYRLRGGKFGVTLELRSSTVARVFEDGSSFQQKGTQLRMGGVYHF